MIFLAVEAVQCEPLSGQNSLVTGKLTGNFADSGRQKGAKDHWEPVIPGLCAKFPKKNNRELIHPIREFESPYQGIKSRAMARAPAEHLSRRPRRAIDREGWRVRPEPSGLRARPSSRRS